MEVDEPDPLELRGAPPLPPNHPSVFINWDDESMDAAEASSSQTVDINTLTSQLVSFTTHFIHDSWRLRRHL
jgi:hypothetical protein